MRHLVGEAFPQQQNRGGNARVAEFLGFSEGEDGEGIGVALERHPGGLDGT